MLCVFYLFLRGDKLGIITIKCENCGKEFQDYKSNHRRFCCVDCKNNYQSKQCDYYKVKKCKGCGKEFRPKENRTQFCGFDCYYNYIRRNSYTKVPRKCKYCGNTFYQNHYKQQFCSKDCAYKWYSEFKQTEEQIQLQTDKVLNAICNGHIKKAYTKPHVIIDELLDSVNINHIDEYNIKYYSVDIYLPDNNLMIEIMGDYWHTNPTTKYKECKSIPQQKTVTRDKRKHTYVQRYYGIEILYLWENDINNNIELCNALINLYINEDGILKDYNSYNYELINNEIKLKDDIVQPMFLCG